MSKRVNHFLAALVVALATSVSSKAFVMIDTAGPREIISPMAFEQAGDAAPKASSNGLRSQAIKLSTKDKALTAYALGHHSWMKSPQNQGELPEGYVVTWGPSLKLKAANGVEDFIKFERWPEIEAGGLVNWTFYPGGKTEDSATISSFTIQTGANSTDLAYIPKTANPTLQKRTERKVSGFATATYGIYQRRPGKILEQFGFVLSAEVRRETNFDDLPKITTAELTNLGPSASGTATRVVLEKSSVVRWGDLESATTVPVTAAFVVTHTANWFARMFSDENATGRLYWAPYARVKAASHAGTSHAAGLNLAVRIKTQPKEGSPKISFPLSLFVERGTDFGQRERKTTVGASTVFSWGP